MFKNKIKYFIVLIISVIVSASCGSSNDVKTILLSKKWKWAYTITPKRKYDSAYYDSLINALKSQIASDNMMAYKLADEEALKNNTSLYDSMKTLTIQYTSDSTYEESISNKLSKGKWSLHQKGNMLEKHTRDSKIEVSNILKITQDSLILETKPYITAFKAIK